MASEPFMIGTLKAIAGLLMRGLLFPVFYGRTLSGWMGAVRLGGPSSIGRRRWIRLEQLNDPGETPAADLLQFKLLQQACVFSGSVFSSRRKATCFFGLFFLTKSLFKPL